MATFTSVASGVWSDVDTWRTVSAWAGVTNYAAGNFVKPTVENGYVYEVTTDAGSSAAGEPTWPTTVGNTVVDDGITWTCRAGTPAADDDVVIAAATVVTLDCVTAIVNSVLVKSTSAGNVPGTLRFMDGYGTPTVPVVLNIKSGAVATNRLQGDNTGAVRGRVLANESGLWTGSTASATLMASQLGTTGAVSDGTGAKRIFTPTVSPAWVVDALIGESMTINGGSAGTITSGGGAKRILTPNPSPAWTVDALIGLNMCVNGKTYAVEDNDATTCLLTTGPPIGDNVSSWGLIYAIEDNDATTVTLTTGPAIAATVTSWRLVTRPLPVDHRATIALGALSSMVTQYLDVLLHCAEPTNKSVRMYGHSDTFTVTDLLNNFITATVGAGTLISDGYPVYLSTTGTLPAPLQPNTLYYCRASTNPTCKLSTDNTTPGIIDITDTGTGTHCITTGILPVASIASDIITLNTVSLPTAPWANLNCVMFTSTGTYPTGIEPNRAYWMNSVSGVTFKITAYPNASMPALSLGTSWTGTLKAYHGCGPITLATVAVLDDVSADTAWAATGDTSTFATCTTLSAAVLADEGPADYDQQRVAVKVIAPTFITLSAAVDSAQYPNSRLWLCSRNVEITSEATTSIGIVDSTSCTGGVYGCSIRSRVGTGTTFYGYGISNGTSIISSGVISGTNYGIQTAVATHTMSGVIAGCYYGFNSPVTPTISGIIAGCSAGLSGTTTVPTITGTISGCSTALSSCVGGTMSGTVRGCTTGINAGFSILCSGIIECCSTALSAPAGIRVTGTLRNNNHALVNTDGVFSGTVSGCMYGSTRCMMELSGATFEGNYTDAYIPMGMKSYASAFKSTLQVSTYKYSELYYTNPLIYHMAYDLPSALGVAQPGYIGCWNPGGYTKTTALVTGTHGQPPRTPPAGIHETYCQDSNAAHLVEFPLKGTTARPCRVIICARQAVASSFVTRATYSIDDPGKALTDSARILTSWQIADTDVWQQYVLSYQPTYERDLILRMLVTGGTSTGTGGDDTLWWFQIIEDEDTSRPRTRIGVAPTR